jgi:WD repeat-containing protein 35
LKVLKLEQQNKGNKKKKSQQAAIPSSTDAAGGNLSMNQTLEGHSSNVACVCWNEVYRKLTSSDSAGLIIVWMLHKGMWFEEMINNRNKSVVVDMKWTSDGSRICIVYEDGAVIVGSVDGNRLWGKELDITLAKVEWSPDGRNILFATQNSEVHLYDNLGNYITKLAIYAVQPNSGAKLIGLEWYNGLNGYLESNVPTLALCFDNGRIQIMRDETDDNPVLIDTGIQANYCKWNANGSVLAVAGAKIPSTEKDTQMVQFYNPFGKHLRTLRVPGSSISSVTWEGAGSLRLALAVDSFIYFANIRPDYEWGYFSNTLVYSFIKQERPENCICFWDTASDERHIKYVKQLIAIRAAGENCVFATKTDDGSGQYILILCNAIGSPVDSKYIDVEPIYLAMTPYHIIVASQDNCYVWQFRTPVNKLTSISLQAQNASKGDTALAQAAKNKGRERLFHIDESADAASSSSIEQLNPNKMNRSQSNDPICCITASKSNLIISRASGTLLRFSLPHLSLENTYVVRCRPQLLALNCDSTRISIIDINGVLTLFDLDLKANSGPTQGAHKNQLNTVGVHLDFERRDAWDMIWSEDNPELFACMEKTRMYVFRGLLPEEPVMSSGYLCHFNDLCIKAVLMDDIIMDPEHPDKDHLVNFETKSLRDTRELLNSVPISEAYQFIEDNSHPRLWRILAESALEQLNFLVADKAFVRCQDYQGIQFVKRLKLLTDRNRQKAEVAAYFRRFDEAENIYLSVDQKELAVELRCRLGDWFRVVQLIQAGAGDDELLNTAFNNIGDYYADRQKWVKAYKFYTKAKNLKQQANCAYTLDDYESLEKLIEQVPAGSTWLRSIGEKFQSVGLCSEAVGAYLRADDSKSAIDCCVLLNQWDLAVELAEKHRFPQIEGLLTKYATHLLQKEKLFQAVELYRKANRFTEAAKLLAQLAQTQAKSRVNPLRAKKLYVMAALQVEKYKQKMLGNDALAAKTSGMTLHQGTVATLQTLLDHDVAVSSDKDLENSWHGAEAFHFYLLAQKQLYAGQLEAAMITALRLEDYEDILDSREIYNLIALTSFYNKYYGQCSKAFIKLEQLEGLKADEQQQYKELALNIFIRYSPVDPAVRKFACTNNKSCDGEVEEWANYCSECNKQYSACIASGRSLANATQSELYTCKQCKHRAYDRELRKLQTCPLCHVAIR